MMVSRQCSRTGCSRAAVATLTYVYADQTVVVGPLATNAEPHSYDLCAEHAQRQTAPRGWDVVRLVSDFDESGQANDDLLALADAVRGEKRKTDSRTHVQATSRPQGKPQSEAPRETSRKGHLRVLRDQ